MGDMENVYFVTALELERRASDSLQGIGSGARIWERDPDVLLWGRIGTYIWAGRIYMWNDPVIFGRMKDCMYMLVGRMEVDCT